MPVLFAWNMQKGCTVTPHTSAVDAKYDRARLKVLEALMKSTVAGFVTEPGIDLRNALTSNDKTALGKLPDGNLYRDTRADNQNDDGACRPLLWSTAESRLAISTSKTSGRVDAYRYPCAQVITHQKAKILLVSLHATSGYSGKFNTKEIIEDFVEFAKQEDYGGVIVGGDFNGHMTGTGYAMPSTPTNQGATASGSAIDGFYFFSNKDLKGDDKYIVEFDIKEPKVFTEMGSTLVFPSDALGARKPGYYVTDDDWGKPAQYRVSDHAPVLINFDLRVIKAPGDSDSDSDDDDSMGV